MQVEAGNMTQHIKALVAKSDDLKSSSDNHMEEGENSLPQAVLSTHGLWHSHTHTYPPTPSPTHIHTNK